jgi:hypothetical protein
MNPHMVAELENARMARELGYLVVKFEPATMAAQERAIHVHNFWVRYSGTGQLHWGCSA